MNQEKIRQLREINQEDQLGRGVPNRFALCLVAGPAVTRKWRADLLKSKEDSGANDLRLSKMESMICPRSNNVVGVCSEG